MYIAQAFKGMHEWWRYALGVFVVFIAWQLIGMIPLGVGVGIKFLGEDGISMPSSIPQMIELLGSNLFLFLMLISFVFGLVGVFVSAKLLHGLSITQLTTTRNKIDWSRFWFIFIIWGVISSGFIFLDYFLAPEDYQFNFQLQPFLVLAVIGILLIPLQTSFEEYFFRGYLMQGLGMVFKNNWAPLLITSVGFGLMHLANPEVEKLGYTIMVYYIGTGLFLGILTLMDDGLELALGFHAANNLFTALLVTADWTAFQTHSVFKDLSDPSETMLFEVFMPVLVVFPVLLFILSKKYKWNNWKVKLVGTVQQPKE